MCEFLGVWVCVKESACGPYKARRYETAFSSALELPKHEAHKTRCWVYLPKNSLNDHKI